MDKTAPAFVIEAVSITDKPSDQTELVTSLTNIGVETILLANFAAHPQFPGENKHIDFPQTEESEILKKQALELGLCALNPRLCRIYHIFADLIAKVA